MTHPTSIEHVVVLVLENRSFDHMLGFLNHPDPGYDGLRGGLHFNLNWDGTEKVEASPHAKRVLPVDPDHSHDAVMEQLSVQGTGAAARPTNEGFVTAYERKGRNLAIPGFGGALAPIVAWNEKRKLAKKTPITGRGPLAMLCQPSDNVPVLSALALEFAVCTRWFCSVPGETWPNRNFLHAATSDGETNIDPRFYTNPTIFELLENAGKTWHIYHDDTPQVWAFKDLWENPRRRANWFDSSRFADHVASGLLPNYSFIEPNHRPPFHVLDDDPVRKGDVSDNQHPGNNIVSNERYDSYDTDQPIDFVRGEALVASVYEALRNNPAVFAKTLLLITYDEHGGLYDHVPPPTNVPNPGKRPTVLSALSRGLFHRTSKLFDFSMLGPRVPAIVVSPLIERSTVSTEVHDHASVPSTLRALFAPQAPPLTSRDAWAKPFHKLVTRDEPRTDLPDLSRYKAAVKPSDEAVDEPSEDLTPDYYDDLAHLSEKVRRRLVRHGVPEARLNLGSPDAKRTRHTTKVFQLAAHRARLVERPDTK